MQTKPLIIADRDIPFLEGVLEPYAEVRYLKGSAITANDVRGAEVLITRTRTRCDRALLEGSRIRLIATSTRTTAAVAASASPRRPDAIRAGYCNTSWPYCAASERNRAGSHPNGHWE